MVLRRSLVTGIAALSVHRLIAGGHIGAMAQVADSDLVGPLADRADFASVWSVVEPGTEFGWGALDLPNGYAEAYASTVFSRVDDLADYFEKRTNKSFSQWFNSNMAGNGIWSTAKISGANVETNFTHFWDNYLVNGPINLVHFLAYMSIFINECGGNLISRTEAIGYPGHPGLAYPFDVITMGNPQKGTWRKASYNQNPNIRAGELFQSDHFNAAHGGLEPASVRGSANPVWLGQKYPQGNFTTSTKQSDAGYLLQADFHKFRGRGLIQTTWRSNYRKIVEFIVDYSGPNEVLQSYKSKWQDTDPEIICTISRDHEWDELFEKTNGIVSGRAIVLHAAAGKYLPLATTTASLNDSNAGSLLVFGDRIGGQGYGNRLKARFVEMAMQLGY